MIGSSILSKMHHWSLLPASLFIVLQQIFAQTAPAAQADAKTFAYEVVSIHPNKPTEGVITYGRVTKDGFVNTGATVHSLIMSAYGLITDDQLVGAPVWTNSDRFDIQAKMDADTAAAFDKLSRDERKRQNGQMLQALLADRFHLKVHRETKEIPVYALVVAKGGSKLKEVPANTYGGYSTGPGMLKGHGIEISQFVLSLSGPAGRLVVDKTGLTGKYDLDLKWTPADSQGSDDSGPSIFAALEEQLGLKLESTKAPEDIVSVEHVERPTEN